MTSDEIGDHAERFSGWAVKLNGMTSELATIYDQIGEIPAPWMHAVVYLALEAMMTSTRLLLLEAQALRKRQLVAAAQEATS